MVEQNSSGSAADPASAASAEAASAASPQMGFAPAVVTAALLVIGNEILSGRTKDKNIGHIARVMTEIGIDLKEVRVVVDEEAAIVDALNELRSRYTYVFTTGGIGPTHDDITADSVAQAFGVPLEVHPRAVELLQARIGELNEARMRMARVPRGAALVENRVSAAPGFWIDNVIVMAGVPSIMQAMLDAVVPRLRTGVRLIAETVRADLREGDIGSELAAIAKDYPDVMIGSYPFMDEVRGPNTDVVLRARDPEKLAAAKTEVERMIARVQAALAQRPAPAGPAARRPGGST
jgi:molybdenum cofactor synthesis domain-containing protein